MRKITFSAARLWVIRSTRARPDGSVEMRFYQTHNFWGHWTELPEEATLFQVAEACEAQLAVYRDWVRSNGASHIDTAEGLEVITLHTAIDQSPLVRTTHVTGRGARP